MTHGMQQWTKIWQMQCAEKIAFPRLKIEKEYIKVFKRAS
jgi:hypothetical protein